MRRGTNNVFKLSGNLALGTANEYPQSDNLNRQPNYGNSSNSNTIKRPSGYGQSYQNTYDYNQKTSTAETRKYSKNHQQTTGSGYSTGLSYGQSSAKKIQYYNQNTLNKMESTDSYNSKPYNQKSNSYNQPQSYSQNSNSYNQNSNSYSQSQSYNQSYNQPQYKNSGSSKDVYGGNSNNYQNKNYNQRDQNRGYQQQDYPKGKSKINQQEMQQYSNPNSRIPLKNTLSKPTQSKNTHQQPSRNDYEQYSNTKEQIKEYDPSTFVLCRQGCGRKFNPDSISKHQKVCKKVFQNKRPQFNVQEQRIIAKQQKKLMKQGEIIQKKIQQKKNQQQKKQNMPKWKAQSIGFRAALKVNRKGGQMTQQEKRIIDEAQQAGMIKCKFCGRTFSQKAAQRHIPFCETQQKKNALKKKK